MKSGLIAGLLVVSLGAVSLATTVTSPANDGIDTANITGAINRAAEPIEAEPVVKGSADFVAALALLDKGEGGAAYQRARGLEDATERRAVQWAAIYYHGEDLDHGTIARFMADAPQFADEAVFRRRMEQALLKGKPQPADVIHVLGGQEPETLDGQIALAKALLATGEQERAVSMARRIWIENFLSEKQEAEMRGTFASLLSDEDHWDRAVRLMMHDRIRGAERLEDHFTAEQKDLLAARAATARRQDDGKALLDALGEEMQTHPVYIYTRVQRARLAGLYEQAVEWLKQAPADAPEPGEWWRERLRISETLLRDGKPQAAFDAVAGFTQGSDGALVEARFLGGWIALAFLDDAETAKAQFEAMAKVSTLPDSISKAHYWLARAEIRLGDFAAADAAYAVAAQHYTVYYGQLARGQLGLRGAGLRPLPDWQDAQPLFNQNEVVRAVRLLAAEGEAKLAVPLLRHLADSLTDAGQLVLAAQLAQEIGAHHAAIAIADIARRKGFALDPFSFPTEGLPENARYAADKAAVYAVARQESLFQLDAVSHVGARGLMQLMPGTAKETATKVGVDYSRGRLTSDPAYNVLLGSTYLSDQLRRYDGSLLLAAAAYNAGPGNANKWIRAFGDPRAPNVDPILWVELIPFEETRKYVQRVLGNYLVYRERLGNEALAMAEALRKIP